MQQPKTKNLYFISVILLVAFIFSTSCKPKLTKAEGEKQLRAFDSEIIMLAQRASETQALRSLHQLMKYNNLPLPFQYNAANTEPGKPYSYNFEKMKGVYSYNKTIKQFYKSSPSDSVILVFPNLSEKDSVARFIISEYEEQLSLWNIQLPVRLNAKMVIANHTVLQAICKGEIQNGFPINYNIDVSFSNFKISTTLQTKLSRKKGKVEIVNIIQKDQKQLLKNDNNLTVTLDNKKQLVFNSIESTTEVFPISVELKIDNKNIDPNSTHFIDNFNANSSILIYGDQHKSLLGRLKLNDRPKNNRLNFAVTYNDGSVEYLDDFLISIEKVLNIKL